MINRNPPNDDAKNEEKAEARSGGEPAIEQAQEEAAKGREEEGGYQ